MEMSKIVNLYMTRCFWCMGEVDDGHRFCRNCVEFCDDIRSDPEIERMSNRIPSHIAFLIPFGPEMTLAINRLSSPHIVSQFTT